MVESQAREKLPHRPLALPRCGARWDQKTVTVQERRPARSGVAAVWRESPLSTSLSVAEVLAKLEARIAFHQEQAAFHAQQEVHHREQNALHLAELQNVRKHAGKVPP